MLFNKNQHLQNLPPAIEADNICVKYGSFYAIENASFSFSQGSLIGLVGPNGGGKSTLLRALVGLMDLASGTVRVIGKSPLKVRHRVGYVPQSDSFNWRFPVTAWNVVMMGRRQRFLSLYSKTDKNIVEHSLERVGLIDKRNSHIYNLSGGQRQRVFIARALAQNADVFLFDEAFSGVDIAAQQSLLNILESICAEGRTVMISTHDLKSISHKFNQVLCINCQVCSYGTPDVAFNLDTLRRLYGNSHAQSVLCN